MSDTKVEVECESCYATYKLLHDLGGSYKVECCSFCGEAIDSDENLDYEEFNDE